MKPKDRVKGTAKFRRTVTPKHRKEHSYCLSVEVVPQMPNRIDLELAESQRQIAMGLGRRSTNPKGLIKALNE